MGLKVRFEAELDGKLKEEMEYWGIGAEDLVVEAMEHSLWGALRRKTDNMCRRCRKPIASSIPLKERDKMRHPLGFCSCQ